MILSRFAAVAGAVPIIDAFQLKLHDNVKKVTRTLAFTFVLLCRSTYVFVTLKGIAVCAIDRFGIARYVRCCG